MSKYPRAKSASVCKICMFMQIAPICPRAEHVLCPCVKRVHVSKCPCAKLLQLTTFLCIESTSAKLQSLPAPPPHTFILKTDFLPELAYPCFFHLSREIINSKLFRFVKTHAYTTPFEVSWQKWRLCLQMIPSGRLSNRLQPHHGTCTEPKCRS